MRRSPSLNLLRTFAIAAQNLSFKSTAEVLHLSPSAVSQQIRQLEAQLGVALFLRQNRTLTLTQEGQSYAREITKALDIIENSTNELVGAHQQSRLKITCVPFIACEIIAPNLDKFCASHPNLTIEIDTPREMLDLQKGKVDLGIRMGKGDWPNLNATLLADVRCTPVCAPDTLKTLRGKGVSSLSECTLYRIEGDEQGWRDWSHAWGSTIRSSALRSSTYLDNYQAVISAVENSQGIAMGIMPLLAKRLQKGSLMLPYPEQWIDHGGIYAVRDKENAKQELVEEFIQWLKAEFSQMQSFSDKYFLTEATK